MEHLPLPRDPIKGHPTIRLASARFHNPGPFLEYPERHGGVLLGQHPHVPTQADALRGLFAAGVSSREVLDYYQGWLFFSLINEFVGEDSDMRDYLSCTFDDGGRLSSAALSTRRLHDDLAKLRASGPLAAIRPGDDYHSHVEKCLDLAFETFDVIEARFPGFSSVFPDEMICLASVAETLDSAVQTSLEHGPARGEQFLSDMFTRFRKKDESREATSPLSPGEELIVAVLEMDPDAQHFPAGAKRSWFSKVAPLLDPTRTETRTAMISAGWCPGDIGKMQDSFTTIDAFYYLSRFRADPSAADLHKDCEMYGCGLRVPAEPRHEAPGCECPGMMAFDEEDLIEIYQKGDIPCFSIGRLEDGSLGMALISCSIDEKSQKDPGNHYVAVSHVWSEGMGNPQSNALPFCQLAHAMHWAMLTYQIVEEKAEEDEKAGSGIHIQTKTKVRQVNLWVDTMCCPATPGYGKNLCLSRMREIYANAYAVLVRSSVLEATSIGDIFQDTSKGVMDVATRIYTSPWMRRMWTLQEGVLAGASRGRGAGDRLCFAFRDSLLSLESVVGLLKQAPEREASLAFRFIGEFRGLSTHMWRLPRGDQQASDGPMARVSFFVKMLTDALKYRGLTVASDEVICLATLLDLRINSARGEVEPLIGDGQTPEDGICELWRRVEAIAGVSGLPSDIIFSSVPRVQVAGFRWAPRTMVQHARFGELQVSHSSSYPSRIVRGGLRVRFPGATLTCLGDPETVGRMLPGGKGPDEEETGGLMDDGGMEDETALPRVVMVRMPKDGEQWYAVRAQDAAERATDDPGPRGSGTSEASTSADLHGDLVRFVRNGACALIFRPGEVIAGPGLLVSTPKSPPSSELGPALEMSSLHREPLQARSEFPAKIMPMAGSACVIAEMSARCIDALRGGIVAEAEQRGGEEFAVSHVWDDEGVVRRLLGETAKSLLGSSTELREALYLDVLSRKASTTDENVLKRFLRYVRHMAYFGGGMIGEMCPEDQAWCVD